MKSVVLVPKTQTDQRNMIESPEKGPNTRGNLIYDEGSISTPWKKVRLFNKWWRGNWMAIWRKINLDSYLIPHTRLNNKYQFQM